MNIEVGAIMNYCYKHFSVKVYEKEIPEQFQIPSMYFPAASTNTGNDTVSTFLKTYTLNIKVFHKDSGQAHDAAESIVDTLSADRNIIQMISEDGEPLDQYVRIKRAETRIADQGVATIVLTWDSAYWYNRDAQPSLDDINFSDGVIKREQD
ncbi:phage tail terminator family protein [Bacillus pumilus]|uniref:phage tail terminator family protein n=1 Tax=Bacillus pumilus TaxID=1408 RepID=UPI00227E9221|nr:phage portal protein [Bacillus pumilus]MCY7575904.1 phage portal protein [Bacillus pumilus]